MIKSLYLRENLGFPSAECEQGSSAISDRALLFPSCREKKERNSIFPPYKDKLATEKVSIRYGATGGYLLVTAFLSPREANSLWRGQKKKKIKNINYRGEKVFLSNLFNFLRFFLNIVRLQGGVCDGPWSKISYSNAPGKTGARRKLRDAKTIKYKKTFCGIGENDDFML